MFLVIVIYSYIVMLFAYHAFIKFVIFSMKTKHHLQKKLCYVLCTLFQ